MNNINYDFHTLDSKIEATVRDEDYCYDLTQKEGNLWIPFLSFPVTQTCNFRCVYCGIGGEATASGKKLISVEYIEKIVREAASKGVKKFRITGGEPFTHPDIDKILELMNDFGFFTLVNTNGSLITRHSSTIKKLNKKF